MDFTKLKYFIDSLEFLDVRACDILVKKDHKEVFRHSMGYSDLEKTKPVSKDDLYWVYSMTKVITVTAALRLVERGKLGLDDKVSDYLPEFADITVMDGDKVKKAEKAMLIRHLFSMQSGLDYDLDAPAIKEARERADATTREVVAAMAKKPLLFEPGERYQYSLSHDVLAAVVEVISGKTYHEYLKEEIFNPLGMTDIGFEPNEEQKTRFSQQYRYDQQTFTCNPIPSVNSFKLSQKYESGGAGLFTSLDTYMKVIDALANKGTAESGYQLLKPETIELMRINQQKEGVYAKPGYGYGLGVRVMIDKERGRSLGPLGEFGWDGAACSYNLIDPDNGIAIVLTLHILNFSMCYDTVHTYIRNLVYQALGLAEKP